MATQNEGPVTIKKYANRRLYNTATSSYVTLEHLADMVKRGQEFNVYDAKSGDDITRSVLAQIIFEEEGKSGQQSMLPIQFLRQLIRFYGDSMQALVPGYLEISMESFSRNQERMREQFATAFGGKNMMKEIEQITRQNMAMFERAVRMFTPFGALMGGRGAPGAPGSATENGATPNDEPPTTGSMAAEEEIADLKGQIEAMKRQLNDLANRK
jgi:polyhydroxyalkanoate synthesis repressor PhaR